MSLAEGRPIKVLSCASCRQRKIKCDKVQPYCTQCSRFGIECSYPSRKPTRRTPRPRQNELLDRISRLESIVGKADPEKLRELDSVGTAGSGSTKSPDSDVKTQATPGEDKKYGDVTASASPRYLSGDFWGNLCQEVEGIKQALDQSSEDDDEDEDGDSPESLEATGTSSAMAPSGFLFGNPDYHERDQLIHPPRDTMIRLWAVYTRNVDPLMKFLHRPTVSKQLQYFAESPSTHPFSPATNALVFAIYFSAITCLRPDACREQFGESQEILAKRYRMSAERALAAADYLNSNSLEVIQAFTLYTAMIRCYSHNRNSWALTSLLVRLAQAQGLHRDRNYRRFTPYIAEMRRRVWHFIIVLDIRGSEDRGTDAIISRGAYNTPEPTPIDDEDFSPDSTGPLLPKNSPAENVICMCTAMCSGIVGYMSHPHTNASGQAEHLFYTEDELIAHVRHLENTFIHTAVPSHLQSVYASEIARVVILKLWLNIQYPFTARPATGPRVNGETMLRTAVSVLELWERMTGQQWDDRFAWWAETYVQWHPLAVALAELCVQPDGELADKAWAVVDRSLASSKAKIADTATGSLWRPIKKLLKKARAARAEAMMKALDINKPPSLAVPISSLSNASQQELHMEQFQATPDFQYPTTETIQPYDSLTMDPSYLFEYPPELLTMGFDPAIGQTMPMEWSLWNEFLNDTKMDSSPGSGGGDSS